MKKAYIMKQQWTVERIGLFCWTLLLITMVIAALLPRSGPAPGESIYLDKLFHFTTVSIATMLPLIFISRRRPAMMLAALIPVLGFGLEYMQREISGRLFSPEDLIANNLGVLAGIFIGLSFRIYRRFKRTGAKK